MKAFIVIVFLFAGLNTSLAQNPSPIDRDQLACLLNPENDTLYIFNFWATWCSPCVREIGYFEEVHKASKDLPRKVVLINLDFPDQFEKRVLPFIAEKKLTAQILQMTDMDYNSWIPLVNEDWSGAIPATLLIKRDKQKFIAREVSKQELIELISNFN